MNSVELFTGLGGLAMGTHLAGFRHLALVERDGSACEAIRLNQRQGAVETRQWPLLECDVREFNFHPYAGRVDLLAAGAPCQPFSIAGRRRGHNDARDMFPEVFRAIQKLRPRAVLVENVRGLGGKALATYFRYILYRMKYPEIDLRQGETLLEHLRRLGNHRATSGELTYNVAFRMLNAADYGVPQSRIRLFIVAFREDLGVKWSFPGPTHGLASLLWDQFHTGEYWQRHGVAPREPGSFGRGIEASAKKVRGSLFKDHLRPWITVRDALSDLGEPEELESLSVARSYPGHTGSDLDMPAKTLKAGVHGIPGGENCLRLSESQVRYFSVREAARLQTFPDSYVVPGPLTRALRLLGNAVPVELARILTQSVRFALEYHAEEQIAGG